MSATELHRAIRETYAQIIQQHLGSPSIAFRECVRLVLQDQPEMIEAEARRLVARMIAEEPHDVPR